MIERTPIEEGVRALRLMLPRTFVDEQRCGRLIECLKRYHRKVPVSTGEPATLVHDQYSHGADAARGLAMIVDQITNGPRATTTKRHGARNAMTA